MTTQLGAPRARLTTPLLRDRFGGDATSLTAVRPGTSAAAEARRIEGDWPTKTSAISEHELFMGYRNVGRRAP